MGRRSEGLIELAGCDLGYLQEGEGPDIVWIPGGDQTGDVYDAQFAAFADFRNTSFDPRASDGPRRRPRRPGRSPFMPPIAPA